MKPETYRVRHIETGAYGSASVQTEMEWHEMHVWVRFADGDERYVPADSIECPSTTTPGREG